MIKPLLVGLLRSNVLVDLAANVQEQLAQETRWAAYALATASFGAGIVLTSVVQGATTSFAPLVIGETVMGLALIVGGGIRLYIARQRLTRMKDMLTLRAARAALASTTTAGLGLASDGLASTGAAIGRMVDKVLTRKSKA